ncbi:MAG: hypothetical protein ACI9MR_003950 [Myxococcota bacterium]|jgi:hypothetical protein
MIMRTNHIPTNLRPMSETTLNLEAGAYAMNSAWKFLLTIVLAVGLIGIADPGPAAAQTLTCENGDTFPCGLQIVAGRLQKVPAVFKFQARVSQAKLPIGQGVFSEVIVKLLAGDIPRCEERFQNVEVRDSVLNLEIGRNMSCELDEEIATQTGLAFQVCLGSSSSCLKPIELSAVPYAVKASYAQLASEAVTADQAAVADYAYRIAADPDLQLLDAMSSGYFDFRTRPDNNGYLQWTPLLNSATPILTITAQSFADQGPMQLEQLVLDAQTTTANGALSVSGPTTITGDITISSNLDLSGDATFMGIGTFEQTVTVGGAAEARDTKTLTVKTGGAEIQTGGLVVGGGGIAATGDSTVTGAFSVSGAGNFQDDVSVSGNLRAAGAVLFPSATGGNAVYAGAALVDNATDGELLVLGPRNWMGFANLPAVHIDAPLVINHDVSTDSQHTATFNGPANFNADTAVNANISFNGGEVDFRNATALPGLREFLGLSPSGDSTLGNWSFAGDFINHSGVSLVQGKSDQNEFEVLSDLRVGGTAVLAGGMSVIGADQGRQAFFDVLTTFRRATRFDKPIRMGFNGGAAVSDLFVPYENGTIHVDDGRALSELVIEAPTRFQRTTILDGVTLQNNWAYFGSNWRLRDGNGFQHTINSTNSFGVFLGFSGNQIRLNQNGSFQGGTRIGGNLFVDGAQVAGSTLTVNGGLTANAGMTVRVNNLTRLVTDATQTRILQRAKVDGVLEVLGGGGSAMLTVANNGVAISRPGVPTQVAGPLQVNSSISAAAGISGSGPLKTKHGSCGFFQGGFCPSGLWAVGVHNFFVFSSNNNNIYCCTVELTQ